jgi:hypothetical protein
MLVVNESDVLSFVIYNPSEANEYQVTIGDIPVADMVPTPEDSGGIALGDRIVWRELCYFESARGHTRILVEHQPRHGVPEKWANLISIGVYVLPSKLGEDRYEYMTDEMETISRGLLVDLYGKSRQTHDLRLSKEGANVHSHDQELHSIETVLTRLDPLLRSIGQRPACRVQAMSVIRHYWGEMRLAPSSISWMARRGEATGKQNRPLSVLTPVKIESFDIPEHRIVRAFLKILVRRAKYCLQVANGHIEAIQSERHLRHIKLSTGPTLFESVDLPRIKRLESAALRAKNSIALATGLAHLPYLRSINPQLLSVHEGTFQRNAEYRLLLYLIRQFLLTNAVCYEGEEWSEITKLTNRLFEQWCYLRIVEGFRTTGLVLKEWSDALRENLKNRFTLDFDRGLLFEGEFGSGLRMRIRYEPWILSRHSATVAGESLCRGTSHNVAWCPDIVIECLQLREAEWHPVYCIVLDCKYTAAVRRQHWSGTEKYLEIRSTRTQRQVVRQLWLIAPALRASILSEDPVITFDNQGPNCAADEAVRFQLIVAPGDDDQIDPFRSFAQGTLAYLRRHFGLGSTDGNTSSSSAMGQ